MQHKKISSSYIIFIFLRPHRPASWAGWAETAQKLAFQAEKSAFWANKVTFFGPKRGFLR
jgi:hypothetical protein